MTPSFTRAEYWLLEAVVQECIPIAELAGMSSHGQTQEALEQALAGLFAEDLIIGTTASDSSRRPHPHLKLTRAEVEAELRRPGVSDGIVNGYGPRAVYYWLTEKGGEAWEAFANPDWSLFLEGFSTICTREDETSEYGEALCPSTWKLERYVDGVHWLGYEIDRSRMVWDEVQPFRATYWKTLPTAHRVRFPIIRRHQLIGWYEMPYDYRELTRWYKWRSR